MELQIQTKLNGFFTKYPLLCFKKGALIHHPGQPIDKVSFVKSGYIKLYKIDKSGNEMTIDILKPGLYFTLIFALTNANSMYFFEAVTDVELWDAPKNDVFDYLKENQDVMLELFKNVSSGFIELLTGYELISSGKAYNKVAALVLRLAERATLRKKDSARVLLNYTPSQQAIAGMLGLTRETVSLELKKLSNQNVIEYNKRVLIVNDIEKLRDVVESAS